MYALPNLVTLSSSIKLFLLSISFRRTLSLRIFSIIPAYCTNRTTLFWNTLTLVSLSYFFHLSYPHISANSKSVCQSLRQNKTRDCFIRKETPHLNKSIQRYLYEITTSRTLTHFLRCQ